MSQPSSTKNFSQPVHWYESSGQFILEEFYTLLESHGGPWALVPITKSRSEFAHLVESLQELISLWVICQEQLKCLRGAEEASIRGGSGHGEAFCKDRMEELIIGLRNLYCGFRTEMEREGFGVEELGEDEGKEEKKAKEWIEKMDRFFEVDDWDERKSGGGTERTEEEKADGKYWRRELLEEWGLDVLSPDEEENLYQDHFVNVRMSGGV